MMTLPQYIHTALIEVGFRYNKRRDVYEVGSLYAKVFISPINGESVVIRWGKVKRTITGRRYKTIASSYVGMMLDANLLIEDIIDSLNVRAVVMSEKIKRIRKGRNIFALSRRFTKRVLS